MNGWQEGWYIPDAEGYEDRSHPASSQLPFAENLINLALGRARVPGPKLVVQAGARIGLWPYILATRVAEVVALEPDADNFECCQKNLASFTNVKLHHAALGAACGQGHLKRSVFSSGEHYVSPDGEQPIEIVTIDSLALSRCDAILLDVEGYELAVLQGAPETLNRHHPVIVVEENGLGVRYDRQPGAVTAHLRTYGYDLVDEFHTLPAEIWQDGAFHGSDLIYAHPDSWKKGR